MKGQASIRRGQPPVFPLEPRPRSPGKRLNGAPRGASQAHRQILNLTTRELLATGGGERILLDGRGRNGYGSATEPQPDEISFASSTSSSASWRAYCAAMAMHSRLRNAALTGMLAETAWQEAELIRASLQSIYGLSGGNVVLAASGTDGELIAAAMASASSPRPLVSIVVAPGETGKGVLLASQGRHYLQSAPLSDRVETGELLEGMEAVQVETVELRDADGRPRLARDVDADVEARASKALAGGADVIVHLLDCSKTGLRGFSLDAAQRLLDRHRGRVSVLVDACQLRASPQRIRKYLAGGCLVLVSGSKFMAGVPFSGALFLPPQVNHLVPLRRIDLKAYSAVADWPANLSSWIKPGSYAANIGLLLRWCAALTEIEAFTVLPETRLFQTTERLSDIIKSTLRECRSLVVMESRQATAKSSWDDVQTIFPILVLDREGKAFLDRPQITRLHRLLAENLQSTGSSTLAEDYLERICHVGQPVQVGSNWALRIAISAPMIEAVARGRLDLSAMRHRLQIVTAKIEYLISKTDLVNA